MPRNGSGQYSLPEAAFIPGSTISSSAVNSDFSDIASALTGSVASDGQTPISAPMKFSDGSPSAPSVTFNTNTNDGFYHLSAGIVGLALIGIEGFLFTAPTANAGSGLLGQGSAVLIPIGIILDYGGSTAPVGWFLPYGQAVSRTTYVELFQVIGTTFGSGDGSTTFNLPDCRGRVTAGRDNMGGSGAGRLTSTIISPDANTVGGVGGAQTIQLSQANLPSAGLTVSGSATVTSTRSDILNFGGLQTPPDTGPPLGSLGVGTGIGLVSTGAITGTTSAMGSDVSHNNVQPTLIVNKIIFAGHP